MLSLSITSAITLTSMKLLGKLIYPLWSVIQVMNVTSPLSGINAAQMRLDVAGHNIANLGTQDFIRQEVQQSDAVNGGISVSLTSRSAGAGNSLEVDMVEQLQSKSLYQANLFVLKANNDMMGTLINIKA
jgi:flagellar basal-body rod protein FlgC